MKTELPQIIMICLLLLTVVSSAIIDELKEFTVNGFAVLLLLALLIWGGFFG